MNKDVLYMYSGISSSYKEEWNYDIQKIDWTAEKDVKQNKPDSERKEPCLYYVRILMCVYPSGNGQRDTLLEVVCIYQSGAEQMAVLCLP